MTFRKYEWFPDIRYGDGVGPFMYHDSWQEYKTVIIIPEAAERVRDYMETQGSRLCF